MYGIDVNPDKVHSDGIASTRSVHTFVGVRPGSVDFSFNNQGSEACQYMQFGGLVRNFACTPSRVVWTRQRLRQSGAEGSGKLIQTNVRRSGDWQRSADESGLGGARRCRFSFNHRHRPRIGDTGLDKRNQYVSIMIG